jgi:CHASE3 domain sensor protein
MRQQWSQTIDDKQPRRILVNTSSKPPASGATTMVSQASDTLANATHGTIDSVKTTVADTVDRGQAAISQAGKVASDMAKSASEQATTFASELEAMTKRNPLGILAGAVVAGVVIGSLMRSRT